ncbi:SAM-dependent methyltransferase [Streptomyces sp. HF10]|uniref:SAM-dependent methyltransferase n=1 Tax=Streptomyces sp. HF10 TaxID=2692233 RepID=UPI0013195A7D|nr:SAM-dependent methyltransferase [Streptomyces sp. HF10]QHC31591.1 SAM-dependent methyltransferase [Streptomyces sp. HF10]
MTASLVRRQPPHVAPAAHADAEARARDWAEIQERMFVPLHEAVYERLDVGPDTRLLGLRCGAGLALLLAAARGAAVTGTDPSPGLLALARERLRPPHGGAPRAELLLGPPADAGTGTGTGPRTGTGTRTGTVTTEPIGSYDLITALDPIRCPSGDPQALAALLARALPRTAPGTAVVLAGWGPQERCATSTVLRVAAKLADPLRSNSRWRPPRRDDLEEAAQRAGLRPDGSGRVSCPFGYADPDSAVRGLLSTGLFDAAIAATDAEQVDKELTEALHPYRRADGTVWMPNVFRYLIARVP